MRSIMKLTKWRKSQTKLQIKFPMLFILQTGILLFLASCGEAGRSVELTEGAEGAEEADLNSLSNSLEGTTFEVNSKGNFLSLQIPESEFQAWNKGNAYKHISEKTKKIYESFEDAFDFIVFVSANEKTPANLYSGRHFRVQNQIEGLGLPIYDNSAQYGSSEGKLKAVIHMARLYSISYGPMLHEIVHLWGNYLFKAKGVWTSGEISLTSHWGYSNVGGQLGGFDSWKHLGSDLYEASLNSVKGGFGGFANGGNSVPYASLELYLMGMIDAQQVPTVHYFKGLQASIAEIKEGRFHANKKESLTIEQIQQKYGDRVPDVSQSQKSFTILFVVLSTAPLNEKQWETLQQQVDNFILKKDDGNARNYNFWEATRGKGSLNLPQLWKILQ